MENSLINNMMSNLPEIKISNDNGYMYNGIVVPRVTQIISSCIHSDSLMYWSNSLGFKHQSYKNVLKLAADIGTQCHQNIDNFMDSNCDINMEFDGDNRKSYNAYCGFVRWWNDIIKNNIVKVIYHEEPLVCPYFGGTLDGLYEINGKLYLIDYKTSNHITFRYCLQLGAYRYMLRTIKNIEIDGAIILKLYKDSGSYNEYALDFSNQDHLNFINDCEDAFMSLVYSYYFVNKIQSDYNKLGWGD